MAPTLEKIRKGKTGKPNVEWAIKDEMSRSRTQNAKGKADTE